MEGELLGSWLSSYELMDDACKNFTVATGLKDVVREGLR